MDYINEYFETIIMIITYFIETYITKNPKGRIAQFIKELDILKYAKNVPFLKNIFNSFTNSDFEAQINELLKNIKQHFKQEMDRIQQEKELEIEFMQLGPIKSKIISLEQTLQTIQNDKITLEDQIAKFTNLKSRLNEL
jgi:hypothetical protein